MSEKTPNDEYKTYADFIDVIRRRRSVRKFEKGRTVSPDVLIKIAEAGRWAPSGGQCATLGFYHRGSAGDAQ